MVHQSGGEALSHELTLLQADLIFLGGLVENAITKSLNSLTSRNLDESQEVIIEDDQIDKRRYDIEDHCMKIIREFAPVAGDLRRVFSSLLCSQELERMGDYAVGISQISIKMGPGPTFKKLVDIPKIADLSINMMKKSLEAVTENDRELSLKIANSVFPDDDKVDELNSSIQKEMIDLMSKESKPIGIRNGTYLIWISHNLERIADRATNIAERAIYQAGFEL
jgi:phosphate transport system protein